VQSSLIGKIQKAQLYAQQPDRVQFQEFSTTFRGEHDSYEVAYRDGSWQCSCHFYPDWKTCSHIMALQRMMANHLPRVSAEAVPV
jgi:hypothetical protein